MAERLVRFLRNGDLFGISWMQHHSDQTSAPARGRVPRYAMETPCGLIKSLARSKNLCWLIVDSEFIVAFQHIDESRSRMSMWQASLAGLQRHLDDGRHRILAVQLLLDLPGGED